MIKELWSRIRGPRLKSVLYQVDQALLRALAGLTAMMRTIPPLRKAMRSHRKMLSFRSDSPEFAFTWVKVDPLIHAHRTVPRLNEEKNRWYFVQRREYCQDESGIACFPHPVIHGFAGGQVVTEEGIYLRGLTPSHWRYQKVPYLNTKVFGGIPQPISGTVAVLSDDRGKANFGHWIFDVLPKLDLLKRAGLFDKVDRFLVYHSDKRFQISTLAATGVSVEKIIKMEDGKCYSAERLLCPMLYAIENWESHRIESLDFLRREFKAVSGAKGTGRRLFISRKDSTFRRVLEEDELFARLSAWGFESITLGGVSMKETIELFDAASIVVGAFGSGLMNVGFCRKGATVVEIATPDFYNCLHWQMSCLARLKHFVFFGNERVIDPTGRNDSIVRDISLNVEECISFIGALLE